MNYFGTGQCFAQRPAGRGSVFTVPMAIALGVLVLVILCCIFAPMISPYSPTEQNLSQALAQPGGGHLLGTDNVGRDLLTRLFYGGRTTLLSALGVVALSMVIGIPLGLISGTLEAGWTPLLARICDVVLSFPSLLLAFVFVAGFGRGVSNSIIALGIVYVPMLVRLVRSLTLVEKNKTYVEAAMSIGYSDMRIMFCHILPNCISTVTVQVTLDLAYAILDLASLSFLGLGVQPPTADWGAMLDEGRNFLLRNPSAGFSSGFCHHCYSSGLKYFQRWSPSVF